MIIIIIINSYFKFILCKDISELKFSHPNPSVFCYLYLFVLSLPTITGVEATNEQNCIKTSVDLRDTANTNVAAVSVKSTGIYTECSVVCPKTTSSIKILAFKLYAMLLASTAVTMLQDSQINSN